MSELNEAQTAVLLEMTKTLAQLRATLGGFRERLSLYSNQLENLIRQVEATPTADTLDMVGHQLIGIAKKAREDEGSMAETISGMGVQAGKPSGGAVSHDQGEQQGPALRNPDMQG